MFVSAILPKFTYSPVLTLRLVLISILFSVVSYYLSNFQPTASAS